MAKPSSQTAYTGSVFLSSAFRPFFLGAALWSIIAIGLWLYILDGERDFVNAIWHGREMIFGFGGAAMAGFVLTAIPNWTGRTPVRGAGLGALAALWLLGRISILAEGFFGLGAIGWLDVLFPLALFWVVLREVLGGNNKRNFPIVALFGVFAFANILSHAEPYFGALNGHGWRLGLSVIIMMISVIGGRIVPNFTRNHIAKSGDTRAPAQPGALDKGVLLIVLLALLSWVFAPGSMFAGSAFLAAGVGQLARVARWRGLSVMRASIVFVLHIGYAWIGIGLLLMGASIVWGGLAPSHALHGLTIGAIGTMIPAVMSRASLGHSGRKIKAGVSLSIAYLLISLAAAARLAAPIWGDYNLMITLSGWLWISAFIIFTVKFAPLYVTPRRP